MSSTQSIRAATDPRSFLDRALGFVGEVHSGEGATALLLSLNGFLVLAAYYVIRPLRSAFLLPVRLTLPGGSVLTGAELQSYSGAILAALFLFIVPAYGSFASKVNRIRLINWLTLFFVSNLAVFSLLGTGGVSTAALGVPFFVWIGIFNLMVVAQFWSFANDVYSPEQGKRLFAIVGFGYAVGAMAGSAITSLLIGRLGEFNLMLVSAAMLLASLGLTNMVHYRQASHAASQAKKVVESPLGREGGFQLVLRHRYLFLIGVITLVAQLVNTNGNYILNETLSKMAHAAIANGTSGGLAERQVIASYMAGTDFWQNLLVVAIQLFLVSRIFKYLGVGGALFFLPGVALCSYGLFAAAPILPLIRAAKITENATDYSLQNTLRRALFLPTSREAKYKALQAVETFFWRAGDMLSGLVTLFIVQIIGFGVRAYAGVNLVLVAVWIVVAILLAKEHRRLS
jgi:AAA family ATP:ADP antiporter